MHYLLNFKTRFSLGYHISDEWTLIGVVDKTESYRQFGTSKNKNTHACRHIMHACRETIIL